MNKLAVEGDYGISRVISVFVVSQGYFAHLSPLLGSILAVLWSRGSSSSSKST